MSSSYRRIQGNSIQYGESFVWAAEEEKKENSLDDVVRQRALIQKEIQKAQNDLVELKNAMAELLQQKDVIIDEAKKIAEETKTQAIIKAEEILAEAQAQKETVINEFKEVGQKQGYEVGYNDGLNKLQADYANQIKNMELLAKASFDVKNEIIYSSEAEILELALLIAQKIVSVKFENDVDCFRNMTQTAISLLKEKENIKMVVNPKLVEYANEIAPELAQQIENLEQIKIVQDKTVSPDGVVVESVESRIDARISTQLETLARTLLIDNRPQGELAEEIEEKITAKVKKAKKND